MPGSWVGLMLAGGVPLRQLVAGRVCCWLLWQQALLALLWQRLVLSLRCWPRVLCLVVALRAKYTAGGAGRVASEPEAVCGICSPACQ